MPGTGLSQHFYLDRIISYAWQVLFLYPFYSQGNRGKESYNLAKVTQLVSTDNTRSINYCAEYFSEPKDSELFKLGRGMILTAF